MKRSRWSKGQHAVPNAECGGPLEYSLMECMSTKSAYAELFREPAPDLSCRRKYISDVFKEKDVRVQYKKRKLICTMRELIYFIAKSYTQDQYQIYICHLFVNLQSVTC